MLDYKRLLIITSLIISFNNYGKSQIHNVFHSPVPIDSNLYISKIETRNIEYLEFLHYAKRDSSIEYFQKVQLNFSEAKPEFGEQVYFRHPKRRSFPVVNVSYEKAQEFCKWKQNAIFQANKDQLIKLNIEKYKIKMRLPSIEEWIRMAVRYDYELNNQPELKNIKTAPIDKSDFKKIIREQMPKANINKYYDSLKQYISQHPVFMLENLSYKGDKVFISKTVNFDFTWPRNTENLKMIIPYDLRGNVSEMTATEGIAKGGNYKSTPGEIKLMDNVRYQYPSELIGFRCVCEIVERE